MESRLKRWVHRAWNFPSWNPGAQHFLRPEPWSPNPLVLWQLSCALVFLVLIINASRLYSIVTKNCLNKLWLDRANVSISYRVRRFWPLLSCGRCQHLVCSVVQVTCFSGQLKKILSKVTVHKYSCESSNITSVNTQNIQRSWILYSLCQRISFSFAMLWKKKRYISWSFS